jgi:hypothetical protein
MINGWHVWWVWPWTGTFSVSRNCVQILATWGIIMLKHEVIAVDEWHHNGPQDLVTVSLCILIAINKMHLCSLSLAYACPYHNPTATMGNSVRNVDLSKHLAHMMSYIMSAICPVQLKLGFTRPNCSQVKIQVRTSSTQLSYPETVCAEIIWLCKHTVSSAVQVAGLRC